MAGQRFGQRRDLRAHLAHRQISELRPVALAGDQRLDHRPPRLSQDLRGDRRQLDPRVLEHLLQPLDLGRPSVALGLAIAGQFPQLTDRRRRHEARSDHPVRGHIREPLGIGHIGLATRDLLDVASVAQPHREPRLKRVVDRLPVHASGLHRHQLHLPLGQPRLQLSEPGRRAREPVLLEHHAAPRAEPAKARHHVVAMDVQTSYPVIDLIHCCLLPAVDDYRPAGEGPW